MRRGGAQTVAVAPLLFACGELLGIEDARVDPRLLPAGGAPSARAPSAGTAPSAGAPSGGAAGKISLGGAGAGAVEVTGSFGGELASGGAPDALDAGAGGVSADGGSGSSAASPCERYCSTITAYCTGSQAQYGDAAQCLRVCASLPEGTIGGPDENSVACRLKYAAKARYAGGLELAAYCRQAGPGGDDRCGSNCEGYCTLMMATCSSEVEAPSFGSYSQCLSTCAELPQIPFVWGDPSVADGNTVQCRTFHVLYAAMMDTEEHCEHAYGLTLCEAP